jgi:poly(glycerol-phosphate) alpha-glucosyltransferase
MKMAFLISSVSRRAGGVHASVCRLGLSLGDAGAVQLQVLGLRDEHTDEDIGQWSPLPTRAFPVHGPRQFGYAPQLRRALFDLDADIVLNHGLWMYPSVASLAWHRRTRRPFIANPHGMLDEWAVKNSRWKKRLAGLLYENPTLQRAACIRALCPAEARSIRAYGLRNPICVIPNGIDLPATLPNTPPPWAGQIEPGRKVMLYLGRLHPKKGLSNLLRAWTQVAACDWDLVIVGWGQGGHEEELKSLARELGIDRRVHFLGAQFGAAKASAYHHADAFVLPSFSEGLPMVVLEAWAYARPVLMTPECNLPEGFEAGAALRIETGVDSIARGLRDLFARSEAERLALGARGRRLVAEHFAWPGLAARTRAVCDWILGGGPPPDCVLTP